MKIDQYETLSVEREGSIDIVVESAEHLNAITTQMVTELRYYFDTFMKTIKPEWCLWAGGVRPSVRLDIKSASDPSVPRPFGAGMGFQVFGRSTSKCAAVPADYQHDSRTGLWWWLCLCPSQRCSDRCGYGENECSFH